MVVPFAAHDRHEGAFLNRTAPYGLGQRFVQSKVGVNTEEFGHSLHYEPPERIGNVLRMRVNLKRALFCIVTAHLIGVIHGGGKDFCTSDPAVAVRVFVVPLSYSHGDDGGAIFSQDAILDSLAETMNSTAGTRYRFTW